MDGGTELGSAQVSRNGLRPGRPGLPRLRARAIDFRASEVFVYTHLCILDPRQHRHRNAWTRGSKKCPVSDPTRLWQGEMLELAARHGWSILTLQFCWLVQLLWIYIIYLLNHFCASRVHWFGQVLCSQWKCITSVAILSIKFADTFVYG